MHSQTTHILSSPIHGKWVFAGKNFLPWEIVLSWDTSHTITPEVFEQLQDDEKCYVNKIDGKYIVMQSPEKYVNHSCDPNTKAVDGSDIAMRSIKKWEEITSDYIGETALLYTKPATCNCGSKNCIQLLKPNSLKPKAFTLVELLVVITIIAITSVAAIAGFSRLGDAQEDRAIAGRVTDTIDELDHAIDTHRIASYEVVFRTGALSYRIERNAYGHTDRMLVTSYDESSFTGALSLASTSTGAWQVALWRDDRFQSSTVGSASGSMSFAFSGSTEIDRYDTSAVVWETVLNSFSWVYYTGENIRSATEKQIRLATISWSTAAYSTLVLRNTLGKRELIGSGATLDTLTGATLTLEKNGKEVIVSLAR